MQMRTHTSSQFNLLHWQLHAPHAPAECTAVSRASTKHNISHEPRATWRSGAAGAIETDGT